MEEQKTQKWRWGVKRWIVLAIALIGAYFASLYAPIMPHIQVAPEVISEKLFTIPYIGDFYMTNTLLASMVVYLIIFVVAFIVKQSTSKDDLIPSGIAGAMETIVEMLYGLAESTAGKYAKKIFPYFFSIILVVLLANWMELIPGVDSIGILHHSDKGYAVQEITPGISAIVKETEGEPGHLFHVIPYIRVPSTDLNFTAALALIAVFMTQFIGVQTQGIRYFSKFFNFTTMFKKPFFGALDFAVGILELISEFSKVLSFAFRLFGNIFAGSVLLFIVGSMIPVFMQSAVLLFEFAIGLIQAFVFGMLTLVFMTQATQGHGNEAHE
ncbi:MAG: F0F1 ATP synthase subunit A [Anaerolineaceae bacterium]|nr:F0F1 ATP synthase subunit A [Anaerolineaceae bacterium]